MHLLIGDLQGCCEALRRLLDHTQASPSRDRITVLGDVVNRGPASADTVRLLMRWGDSAQVLLGNHDLHLLAVAHGVRTAHRSDTLDELLHAPDREALLDWLRRRPLARMAEGWLCVHAGVAPAWTSADVLALAAEVERELQGPNLPALLAQMYGNTPDRWSDDLQGSDRWRCIINALTRMRWCHADGRQDFLVKEGTAAAPAGLLPWFAVPGRRTQGQAMAFGHWSTLGLKLEADLLALDTGCVWGGALTAVRVDGGRRECFQVPCSAQQQPGPLHS